MKKDEIDAHDERIAALARKRFKSLADVEAREVDWLWPGFIPFNMATMCDGYPDVGKSYLGIHIAAQGSIGGTLPGVPKLRKFRTLILTTENHAEYVLRPRFDALGGDPEYVHYDKTGAPLDKEGFEVLRHKVREFRPRLILMDPLFAYIPPGANMYHPNTIRPFMSNLDKIVDLCDAALLAIRHPTKTKRESVVYQGAGGVDVIAAARSGFIVTRHPQDEDLKLVLPIKHNLSAKVPGQMFELVARREQLPVLRWRGETDLCAETVVNADVSDRAEAQKSAIEWLRGQLKGSAKPATAISAAAESAGHADITIRRAKKKLGVKSVKDKDTSRWVWELPDTK